MAKLMKMKVTTRAVLQRINRKLAPGMEKLCVPRNENMRLAVGDYYILDIRLNGVVSKDVDPEALARELGVLKGYEVIAD
jgi:hypothetical protein